MTDFSSIALSPALIQSVSDAGYHGMTAVQAASLPHILEGRDVIAQAKTGSGKTAAFALGILQNLHLHRHAVHSLVLCPTRELAEQVSTEIRALARLIPNVKVLSLCGGVPRRSHLKALQRPPHIVVGTPGRVLDLLMRGALDLSRVHLLVLDEADRMLAMGFADDIQSITAATPAARQTLLFSATYSDDIRGLSKRYQRNVKDVRVDALVAPGDLRQEFVESADDDKFEMLQHLLNQVRPRQALVFCNTRRLTRDLAQRLFDNGHSALALSGDLEQRERDEVMVQFTNLSAVVLVATDVAARGLDVEDLPLVVNYELPKEAELYVHRVGRTGRAGKAGLAISLVSPHERRRNLHEIETACGRAAVWRDIPVDALKAAPLIGEMRTLIIQAGRSDKLRAGDVLGALTRENLIAAHAVGKIDIHSRRTYVALRRDSAGQAVQILRAGKIKGRRFRVHLLNSARRSPASPMTTELESTR